MHAGWPVLERLAGHVGGTRVLALPFLRGLAMLAAVAWVALTPPSSPHWGLAAAVVCAFVAYSLALGLALWLGPAYVLELGVWVLVADLGFALVLIGLAGAHSAVYLALLLIASVQSYYYGLARGCVVGAVAGLGYLAVAWGDLTPHDWADTVIRLTMLLGAPAGVGILANIEAAERRNVARLTGEARAREQFIVSVLESLREGVIALDPAGRVLTLNRALETRYGIEASEVVGGRLLDVVPNYRPEGLTEPLERLLRGEIEEFTIAALEHDTLRRGRVVQHVKGSLLTRAGQPAGAVLLVEDITERVGLERAARQAEKLAALGTLAAGLAHELNNPIGIISSRTELMLLDHEARPLPSEVREDLMVLHRNAQRVARISHGLLSFARQSPGKQEPVDLNQVVEETLVLVDRQMARSGIALRTSLAPGLASIHGDPNALQQVVLNLVTNARDVLPAGGEIVIETQAVVDRPTAVRLTVRDTGQGIAPEVLPRIFDPFFTTKEHGTGLGLSIIHGIVRDHQGTIDVESRPGQGTTFVLTFPVVGAEG